MSAPDTVTRSDDALYRGLTDDLRLAHLLADDADSIAMSRFKALDLHVTTKPDLTPTPPSRRPCAAPSAGPGPGMPCRARRWASPAGVRGAG